MGVVVLCSVLGNALLLLEDVPQDRLTVVQHALCASPRVRRREVRVGERGGEWGERTIRGGVERKEQGGGRREVEVEARSHQESQQARGMVVEKESRRRNP